MKFIALFFFFAFLMTVMAAPEAAIEERAGGPAGVPCILHTDCKLACDQLCSFYDNPTCLYNRCWCRV